MTTQGKTDPRPRSTEAHRVLRPAGEGPYVKVEAFGRGGMIMPATYFSTAGQLFPTARATAETAAERDTAAMTA